MTEIQESLTEPNYLFVIYFNLIYQIDCYHETLIDTENC